MVIVLVALPGPAQASHDYDGIVPTVLSPLSCVNASGPTDPAARVCQTDNAGLVWYADSASPGELEANDFASLQLMLELQFEPTNLTVTYDSTPVFSGSGETDIIFQEAETDLPIPDGAAGVTWCNDAVNGGSYQCDQTYVRIMSPDGYRLFGASIACHETGHAVGLVHGDRAVPAMDPGDHRLGCMVNEDEFLLDLGPASAHLINITYQG
jgi:hypothetical protein